MKQNYVVLINQGDKTVMHLAQNVECELDILRFCVEGSKYTYKFSLCAIHKDNSGFLIDCTKLKLISVEEV